MVERDHWLIWGVGGTRRKPLKFQESRSVVPDLNSRHPEDVAWVPPTLPLRSIRDPLAVVYSTTPYQL